MPQKPNNPTKKTNVHDQWALNGKGMLKGDEWVDNTFALARYQEKQKRRAKMEKDSRKKNRENR